jgi:hypothetical protein
MTDKKTKPRSPAIDYFAAAVPAAIYNLVFGTLETVNNVARVSLLRSHPKNIFKIICRHFISLSIRLNYILISILIFKNV